ncbi:oxidoreductase [Acrasis kona]|uniref:Oxidoreductase n=1 Tax=Acrasis kona TaxID=1008807 RepID=A0AAW2YMD4_9EUKA
MAIEQHTTSTELKYTEAPAHIKKFYTNINDIEDTNVSRKDYKANINDIRTAPNQSDLKLDVTGFQLFRSESTFKNFNVESEVKEVYYPQVIDLLKKKTGASRIQIYDHTIRRNVPGQKDDSPDKRQPVSLVHIDQTPKAAKARVHRHNPEDAEELLTKRYQLINVWRPIENPAFDRPLAVCDFRSIKKEDLVPVSLIYPDYEGETYGVRYNPEHKWYYVKDMTEDEVLFIKCFDSDHFKDETISGLTPHTAFVDPQTSESAPLRKSIEVRAIVYYD